MTNREEVAKKLRKLFPLYRDKDIYQAVLGRPPIDMMISERKQMVNRLADLIDPTCTADIKREDNGIDAQPYYTSSCGNCGALWDTITGAALLPKYCPHCGARVVR